MEQNPDNTRYRPNDGRGPRRTPEEEREYYYARIRARFSAEGMRRLSYVNIFVLLAVIAAFFLGSLLLEKPTVSAIEKRDLARFPEVNEETLFSGKLSRGIETWYSDTFPFRDGFVSLSAVVDEAHGVRVDDVRIVAPSGGEAQDIPPNSATPSNSPQGASGPDSASSNASEGSQREESGASSEGASAVPPPSDDGAAPGAINNGTFVYKGMAMSLYGGNSASGGWYADVLNQYHKELPDVQIYNMIIPTAIEFYVPDKYRDLTQSQKKMIDYVYAALDPAVKKVDAYSKLAEHTSEYLYFRTDHHWTGLGAYYAYTAFCEQAGFTPLAVSDFETRRLENFIGTMYSQTQDTTLLQNPDYVDYYVFKQPYTAKRYGIDSPYSGVETSLWGEYAKSPNSYSVFLHGDFPLLEIKTGIPNGRKILMVKESFGNAFAPYLINHYEEVYIVDQRYFQLPLVEFIKQKGINELLFANNSFAVCTPYHIRCIDGIRHQPYVPRNVAPAPTPEPTPEPTEEPVQEAMANADEEPSGMLRRKPKQNTDKPPMA